MSDYLSPGDPEIQTDPDILDVYAWRLAMEADPVRLMIAASEMASGLHWIARGDSPFSAVEIAAFKLTEAGERATPVRDEGVPCG